MTTLKFAEGVLSHESLWNRFNENRIKHRLGHALLLIGPLHVNLFGLATRMAATLFCKELTTPCGHCSSCQMIAVKEHPDLTCVIPDKANAVIKIDQIRLLQPLVFTSPQLSAHRVIIINPAEKMNGSAANALLKMLEEPPLTTYFILIAEHISTLPPTILSRCQHWHSANSSTFSSDYLEQGHCYPPDSERGKMFALCESIVDELRALTRHELSVNTLALKWSVLEFNELIWLLYLIHAQMISDCFKITCQLRPLTAKISDLAKHLQPVRLFAQLDKINAIIRNLNHNVSINQLLALEELLMGYA